MGLGRRRRKVLAGQDIACVESGFAEDMGRDAPALVTIGDGAE